MAKAWQFNSNVRANLCQPFALQNFSRAHSDAVFKGFFQGTKIGHKLKSCGFWFLEYLQGVYYQSPVMKWLFKKWQIRFRSFWMGKLFLSLRSDPSPLFAELKAPLRQSLQDYINEYPFALGALPKALRQDLNFVLPIVQHKGFQLSRLPRALRDNKELVRAGVMQNGHAILSASDRLRNDPEIYRIAQRTFPNLPRYFTLERR